MGEQRAVLGWLLSSGDTIGVVMGTASAGKTFLLDTAPRIGGTGRLPVRGTATAVVQLRPCLCANCRSNIDAVDAIRPNGTTTTFANPAR